MQDQLQKRIEKLKIMRESAKRRSGLYSDIMKLDDKSTTRSLRSLTKAPAPGKKIQKIGFIMFWIPEPTGVTCAVGGPMILAGRYLETSNPWLLMNQNLRFVLPMFCHQV